VSVSVDSGTRQPAQASIEAGPYPDIGPSAEPSAKSARALSRAHPATCAACDRPLRGRSREACSPRCRAKLTRLRRAAWLIAWATRTYAALGVV
jgi:hypothetical protein